MTALLQDYATRGAERDASRVALVMGGERVTYGELEANSNRLARVLVERGCGRGDRVCLLAEKSPSAIVAMHAVLKAGAVYVPIDLASPASRVAKIIQATEPRLALASWRAVSLIDELVAQGRLRAEIGSLEDAPLDGQRFSSAFGRGDWAELPPEPVVRAQRPEPLAHILFTSGSTGTPKGVIITHSNVVAFLQWAVPYFQICSSDRCSGHPPLHFDLSTFDIYGTLAAGGELHLIDRDLGIDPRRLAAIIRDSKLTQWFSVPSVLTYMAKFDAVKQGDFPALERLLWCGEVLPTPILVHWMKRLSHVKFTNLYGPTEATIASSYHTVRTCPTDPAQTIPIGRPCGGEELVLLDEELHPVPVGEVGQIFIAGAGLSPGYWRDQAKTEAAFIPDPRPGSEGGRVYRTGDLGRVHEDGVFEFLGRVDSQIKSRGYRIELGEVEAAVNEISIVRECAVVAVDKAEFGGTAICCAYAPVEGARVDAVDLRSEVSKLLPSYMLPVRWRSLDPLPKNANGKIDRRAIRELFQADLPAGTLAGSTRGP